MKTMINFKNGLFLIMLFLTFSSYANNDPASINMKENRMKRIVSRTIDFPKVSGEMISNKEVVSVDLNVTAEGRIVVNEINGNPSFTKYVKEKLEKIVLKNMKELSGKSFIYKFVFSK